MIVQVDTIVIGAGIAGLTYAHARGPEASLVVLESRARPGGFIDTTTFPGGHAECGPEALQGNTAETAALLAELGLVIKRAPSTASERYVVRRAAPSRSASTPAPADERSDYWPRDRAVAGELACVPFSPRAFLRSPLLSAGGKLRLLTEPFRDRRAALDGSIAAFVRHRLGPEVLEWLVDPFVMGVHAGDVEQLSLEATFPGLRAMVVQHGSLFSALRARGRASRAERARLEAAGAEKPDAPANPMFSLEGGLAALPRALASALGERLRVSSPATRVERHAQSWTVTSAERTYVASRVVVAVSAPSAAHLLRDAESVLASELATIQSESLVTVACLWDRDRVAHPLDGVGYLVPSRVGVRHLGTLFSSSIDPTRCPAGTVLVRVFLGGARDPSMVTTSDEDILDIIAREVAPLLGAAGPPRWTSIVRWPAALPRYDLDHPQRLDRVRALVSAQPGLFLLGNYLQGVSINALIEGAREMARRHDA